MFIYILYLVSALSLLSEVHGRCFDPSPAFPPPTLTKGSPLLDEVFDNITTALADIIGAPVFNTTAFSIEVTSSEDTIWQHHHTALNRNETRPGADVVTSDSVYRIASISKIFTVLSVLQLEEAGRLNLDDTIDRYIPEFQEKQSSSIQWGGITLRALANQLSGLPRDFAQSDLVNEEEDMTQKGFPPIAKTDLLVKCDEYTNYEVPCTESDLISNLRGMRPLFAPNQKSTYSNLNYELLGLVIESVTGMNFSTYLETAIMGPLNMTSTSILKPGDDVAVLPPNNYWNVDAGIENATEGLFSSSNDLSKLLRYILTYYNGVTSAINWLHPSSFASNMNSFYGMPWEIFRTDKILPNTSRPVTFMTKSGSLPGYYSNIIAVPEYSLGITILIGGEYDALAKVREAVTIPLIRAVESIAQQDLAIRYTGHFVSTSSPDLNSSVTFSHDPSKGLFIRSLISNGTDVLKTWSPGWLGSSSASLGRIQVIPTLMPLQDPAGQRKGEIWWMMSVPEPKQDQGIWDDFCITDDYGISYGSKPISEVIFWEDDHGEITEVEFTVLRVGLTRYDEMADGEDPATEVTYSGKQEQKVIIA